MASPPLASNTGVIMVVGQKIALGRSCKHQAVTVLASETTLAIELDEGDVRVSPFRPVSLANPLADACSGR
jgi:hypothetical protein